GTSHTPGLDQHDYLLLSGETIHLEFRTRSQRERAHSKDLLRSNPSLRTFSMPKKSLKLSTRVKDLMEVPPVVIPENSTVDEAASMMWEKNIGSLIVVGDSGTMVGIVTERDMLFAITK